MSHRRPWLPGLILTLLSVTVALTAATRLAAQELKKITLSYSAVSMTWLPVKVRSPRRKSTRLLRTGTRREIVSPLTVRVMSAV